MKTLVVAFLLFLIFSISYRVNSSISLQCNQVLCLTVPIQYQCIVSDSALLRWRIRNESIATLDTRSYTNGDALASFTPILNAPDFSTDLSSTSPSIISTISFTVQSSINGYTILCEDLGGDNESCTIDIEGPPSPPVNITVSFTDTTADITWIPSNNSSSQCITSYTINTNTSNSIINTTDTSTSILLTGLSVGIYCISIASIDTANRIGTYSEQECFELTEPSELSLHQEAFDGTTDDNAIIRLSWIFDSFTNPPLTATYLNISTESSYTITMLPASTTQCNITVMRGINYTASIFGENILGNGTNTSIVIFIDEMSITISSSVTVSPTSNTADSSSNVAVAIAVPIGLIVVGIISIMIIVTIILVVVTTKRHNCSLVTKNSIETTNVNNTESEDTTRKVVRLESGNTVKLQSSPDGMHLQILEDGIVGENETACFKVHIRDQDRISLETIDGGKHLAVIKECYYLECSDGNNNDCILAITNIAEDRQCAMVKSATHGDAYIRVLPSGQVEITTVTTPLSDNLLFKVPHIINMMKTKNTKKSNNGNIINANDANNDDIKEEDDCVVNSSIGDGSDDGKVEVVIFKSKLNNKYLRIQQNGHIDCLGDGIKWTNTDTDRQFKLFPGATLDSFKLLNIVNDKYLTIRPHYCVKEMDEYTSSDCDLIPHYTDSTDGITFVSFTSAKYRCATITMKPDSDDIIVSTETTDKHQFRIISALTKDTQANTDIPQPLDPKHETTNDDENKVTAV